MFLGRRECLKVTTGSWSAILMIKPLTIIAQPVSASTETMFVLRYFMARHAIPIVVIDLGFRWLFDLIDGVEHLYARHGNIPLVV